LGAPFGKLRNCLGAALATPPPDASAAKGKFKSAESRRNKKNEEKRKNFKELLLI